MPIWKMKAQWKNNSGKRNSFGTVNELNVEEYNKVIQNGKLSWVGINVKQRTAYMLDDTTNS